MNKIKIAGIMIIACLVLWHGTGCAAHPEGRQWKARWNSDCFMPVYGRQKLPWHVSGKTVHKKHKPESEVAGFRKDQTNGKGDVLEPQYGNQGRPAPDMSHIPADSENIAYIDCPGPHLYDGDATGVKETGGNSAPAQADDAE